MLLSRRQLKLEISFPLHPCFRVEICAKDPVILRKVAITNDAIIQYGQVHSKRRPYIREGGCPDRIVLRQSLVFTQQLLHLRVYDQELLRRYFEVRSGKSAELKKLPVSFASLLFHA